MRKTLVAILLATFSGIALAAGPVFEQGIDRVYTCEPPTTRIDGTPLTNGELDFTTITVRNTDTADVYSYTPQDIFCTTVIDTNSIVPGQYEIVQTITDIAGRTSDSSTPAVPFMLVPQAAPPRAPTNGVIQ